MDKTTELSRRFFQAVKSRCFIFGGPFIKSYKKMGVSQITPISDLRLRLFSAQFLFQLRTGLVALVQSLDHIIGDVVFRIGVK